MQDLKLVKKEIAAALKAKFKGVKFSLKTNRILNRTIVISWAGMPFVDDVKTIVSQWHTYQNYSDDNEHYIHHANIEIVCERTHTEDELNFVINGILELYGRIVNNDKINFINPVGGFGVEIKKDWSHNPKNAVKHTEVWKQWGNNGMSILLADKDSYCFLEDSYFHWHKISG